MSKYRAKPCDLGAIKTYPLESRRGKVGASMFARPHVKADPFRIFLQSLPDILAARNLKDLALAIVDARQKQ